MKAAGILLNFKNDSNRILSWYIKLQRTISGHYSLSLTKMLLWAEKSPKILLYCEPLEKCSRIEKRRKLHRHFLHVSKERRLSLVRGSRVFHDKEYLVLIKDVCNSSFVCLRFIRPPLQPVVRLALGSRFNDTVCLALKKHEHNQYWIPNTSLRYFSTWLIKPKRAKK